MIYYVIYMINHLYDNKKIILKYIKYYIKSVKNGNKPINHKIYDKKYIQPTINNDIFKYNLDNNDSTPFINNFIKYFYDSVLSLLSESSYEVLDSENEYIRKDVRTKYIINMATNKNMIKLFCLTILFYYVLSHTSIKKYYVTIDYEFTQRQIRLIQLNFETESIKNEYSQSFVWVCNPSELSKSIIKLLVTKLMTKKKIIKITQGAESLDIPYVYTHLFNENKKYILKFSKSVVDLRFYCEYFKATKKTNEKKCSIYDLLKYFGTISDDKYNELEDINYKLGPSQDRVWDIHKLSSFHSKYAYYDVIFLKQCLKDIIRKVKLETPLLINSYKYISQITGFTYVEKWNVSTIINNAKLEVDIMNNYIIKYKNNNLTLYGIYNSFLENLIIPKINMDINSILAVNYFKSGLVILFKKIIYSILLDNYKIFKKKNEYYNEKLNIKSMIEKIKSIGFNHLAILLLTLHEHAINILPKLYI